MKKCPYCAEEIQDEAVVCRYCGRDLIQQPTIPAEHHTITLGVQTVKKNSNPAGIIILSLIVIIVVLYALGNLGSSKGGTSTPPAQVTYSITYRVTGTAHSASLTYENATGDTEQIDSVTVPWTKTIVVKQGAYLYISAQNNQESGSITCDILLENTSVKTSTSSGAFVIATCSGHL